MAYITDLEGVYANGVEIGLKAKGGKDLAFIYVPEAVASAAVFTQNKCCGANISYTKKALKTNTLKAMIINAGNANAATGDQGLKNCKKMAQLAAKKLGLRTTEVGVASTGIIGKQLDMPIVEAGIEKLFQDIYVKDGDAASKAILTTDLVEKLASAEAKIGKKTIKVVGMAKGSGMIEPNMATMLGFLTTNVAISQDLLQTWLQEAVDKSFNMMSVDTDTSTSDMVVIFATGEYQFSVRNKEEVQAFKELLLDVCVALAKKVARDGEGATKLIEVRVTGAATHTEAKKIAKSIVNSPLIKTAIHGADPNWGRLLMAVGKTEGIRINQNSLTFSFGNVNVFKEGEPQPFDKNQARKELSQEEVVIHVDCGLSTGTATAWGCDLTKGYIDINVDYN